MANELPEESQEQDPFSAMRDAKPWWELIAQAERTFKTYNDKCDGVDKLYANLEKLANTARDRQFQLFWANLEVLKPAVYARAPVPVVTGRFKDRKPLVRHASELLERSLVTSFDTEDIHETLKLVRDDLVTNARGVLWARYEDQGRGEKVCYDHVNRKDFMHDPARKWKEVGWVSRRSWLTKDQGVERFGPIFANATFKEKDTDKSGDHKGIEKAAVWEMWHRAAGAVIWLSEGMEEVLDISEPFLDLEGFFPCPRPAYGTTQRDTLVPVPDMLFYKDQLEEINELTDRIAALAEGLRLKGFYAGGSEDIGEAIELAIKSTDNRQTMIPVANFAALGGAKLTESIVWMPLDMVAATIQQLIALRKELIQDVYEITGISDIMRGATDAAETLGAQRLKSQYGSVRIKDRQEEMIRIARDATRISGEVMAENFQPGTLMAMSQYEEVPTQQQVQRQIMEIDQRIRQAAQNPQLVQQAQQNPQMAQQMLQQANQQKQEIGQQITLEKVIEFLRDQRMRPFTLEIETDSTIQPDEDQAKQRTTEFLGALATALAQLGPLVQMEPQSAPFAAEVLKFAVGPFRAGRQLESAIDEFADQMAKKAQQPKADPEAEKVKAEAATQQAEMQLKARELEADIAMQEREIALKEREQASDEEIAAAKLDLDRMKLGLQEVQSQRADRTRAMGNGEQMGPTQSPTPRNDEEDEMNRAVLEQMAQANSTNQQMLQFLAQQNRTMMQALSKMGAALTAPKEIIRDETGAPIGVRSVTVN